MTDARRLVPLALFTLALAAAASAAEPLPDPAPAPDDAAVTARDPFVPLDGSTSPGCTGGLTCIGAREIVLSALATTPRGPVCSLQGGARGETYFAHEGDRLRDGVIDSIDVARGIVSIRVARPSDVKPWETLALGLGAPDAPR